MSNDPQRMWTRLTASLFVAIAIACGCGTERPQAASGDGRTNGSFPTGSRCTEEGAFSSCHAVVAEHQGYVDCFDGSQQCVGGLWGPCQGAPNVGGSITTRALGGGGLRTASLSSSSPTGAPCRAIPATRTAMASTKCRRFRSSRQRAPPQRSSRPLSRRPTSTRSGKTRRSPPVARRRLLLRR